MRWVLSYCAQQSSGIESFPRDPEHIEKGFIFAGMPARSGVTSALPGARGLERRQRHHGRARQLHPCQRADRQRRALVDKLGERYEMTRANIKKWTVGQPIHAPLDALEALLKKQPIDAGQIREIVLRYQPARSPTTAARRISTCQHAVAVMLTDKTLTFKSIHDRGPAAGSGHRPAPRKDPARGCPDAAETRLAHRSSDHHGRRHVIDAGQSRTGVLGTAANPMTRDQLVAKCRDLMAPVLGDRRRRV